MKKTIIKCKTFIYLAQYYIKQRDLNDRKSVPKKMGAFHSVDAYQSRPPPIGHLTDWLAVIFRGPDWLPEPPPFVHQFCLPEPPPFVHHFCEYY